MANKEEEEKTYRIVNMNSGLISLVAFTILLTVLLSESSALAQDHKDADLIILSKWDRGIKLQSKNIFTIFTLKPALKK